MIGYTKMMSGISFEFGCPINGLILGMVPLWPMLILLDPLGPVWLIWTPEKNVVHASAVYRLLVFKCSVIINIISFSRTHRPRE
jgi:hypothetical protein